MHFSDESVFAATEHDWSIAAVPSTIWSPRHEDTDASQQRCLSGTKTDAKHAKLTRMNVQVEKITETGTCPVRESKATGQMQILTEGVNRCTRFTGKEHEASTMLLQNGIVHRQVGGSAFVTLERFKLETNIRHLAIILSIFEIWQFWFFEDAVLELYMRQSNGRWAMNQLKTCNLWNPMTLQEQALSLDDVGHRSILTLQAGELANVVERKFLHLGR